MKRITAIFIAALLVVAALSSVTEAAKPLKAFISGAKIAIVEGRPDEALVLLDSVSLFYGPVPEAHQWVFRVYADKVESSSGLDAKRPYLEKMLAYIDSVHLVCDGALPVKDKKYLKDCKDYTQLGDSTKVKFFRIFYNQGHEQIKTLERLAGDLNNATDSATQAYISEDINHNIDSCIANMSMAIMVDSSQFSPYVAIADAYDRAGNYPKAIEWMERGYALAADPSMLAQQLAYYYIQTDDYCGAIKYLKQYVEAHPDSLTTMNYLAICYNNCGFDPARRVYLDSAMMVNRQILSKVPDEPSVLGAVGRYFLMQAQQLSDSASQARQAEAQAFAAQFDARRREFFDSSRTYFRRAFEADTTDVAMAEQFGFTSALLEDCESAVRAFEIVAAARPDDIDNWTSLGDCYLRLSKWTDAIRAYEKVSELNPGRKAIWDNLAALYQQTGQKDKAAEAARKSQEL